MEQSIYKAKVGDVVALKSGSPPMTIESVALNMAQCVFFTTQGMCKMEVDVNALTPSWLDGCSCCNPKFSVRY